MTSQPSNHTKRPSMTTRNTSVDLSNAGGGTLIVLNYLVLIPGFLPTLALTGLLIVAVLLPALALGLVAAVAIGPPYAIWRLATRGRRRGRRDEARARTTLGSPNPA
jgi:hypothetical protein